jgi:hypothetical protein
VALFYVFWNYRFSFQITPSGFIPEDRGIIFADVTLPPGSTREHGKYCEGIRLYN